MIATEFRAGEWIKFQQKFHDYVMGFQDALGRALSDAAEVIVHIARTKYLVGGHPLKVVTGRLRSSVTKDPVFGAYKTGNRYWVYVGTSVIYGRTHEHGATIRVRTAEWLIFKIGERWIKTKQVNIPPRPWLQPSLKDSLPITTKILARAGAWRR